MTTATIPVTGQIREIRNGLLFTSSGDRRDSYNAKYYRPHVEPQPAKPNDTFAKLLELEMRKRTRYPGPVPPERAMSKRQTCSNLLELALKTQVWRVRDIYTCQYLTMMRRRLPKWREVNNSDGQADR